ncbi:unnamed protein product [Nezara viridula]|uniref:Uncharacterized protein n=1 Tax=Nezara viridula TaxID=85310 RepID=A0A9P0EAV9_NEZVI|nr:unnamed protein product [Nezara viridula]
MSSNPGSIYLDNLGDLHGLAIQAQTSLTDPTPAQPHTLHRGGIKQADTKTISRNMKRPYILKARSLPLL